MPSSTRPTTPGPSDVPQRLKRSMSDAESAPQNQKRARRASSAEPSATRDSNRDTKRRRRKKKKAPLVTPPVKIEAHNRLDERARAPLSARNEIIRFSSAPSEADLPTNSPCATKQEPSTKLLNQMRLGSLQTLDEITESRSQGVSSPPNNTEQRPFHGLSSCPLEEKIAQLEAELKSKNKLIASHQAFLNQVQQAATCQVCLDLMYKPYALAPCGHLACHSCLVNWFTAPLPDNRPTPPAISRRKTCPHCRAVVRERPVEVWGVKGIAQAAGKSGLLANQLPLPVEDPENLNANVDPWMDIFPKPGAAPRRFPWFVDVDDDDIHIAEIAPRGEDVGMLDMEDGGIYRCLDCMHEIWDGVCSNCGRVYPGHRPEGDDDDEGDPAGWLEDRMGVEEVDVADDPGWMGLEDGEADDDGDPEDWSPYEPWRHRFNVFRGPWGFLGAIHVDDEDEGEEEEIGRIEDLGVVEEDEGSEGEGYESSFIDDDDNEVVRVTGFVDGPRVYEFCGDEDGYRPERRSPVIDLDSDDGDEQARLSEHRRAAHRDAAAFISSDEDGEGDMVPARRRGRGRFVESDGSDAYSA